MNKRTFIVVLLVLVLFSLNFSVAREIDNSTSDDSSLPVGTKVLTTSDINQTVLKAAKLSSQIDVKSNTTFDVIGSYFKIKLSDENGTALTNANVTFTLAGVKYVKTTNANGIASLQLKLDDGSYKITTKFLGNSNYKSSSLTTTITMNNTRIVDEGLSNSEIQNIIDNAKVKNVILFKGNNHSDINLMITKRITLLSNVNTILTSSSGPVITIKGENASSSIIKGFNIQSASNGIAISDSNYVIIINNTLSGKGNGIVATGTRYLNVTNNEFVKNSKSGIVVANSNNTYITNNTINSNGVNGIELANCRNLYIYYNSISRNAQNGIYLSKTVNGVSYADKSSNLKIGKNTIVRNGNDGINIHSAGDNIKITYNTINQNIFNGITLGDVGSNTIQSNEIYKNGYNGIRFSDEYVKPKNQEISSNVIYANQHREVEAKDTYYQENGNPLAIGDNWYSDYNLICPKVKTNNFDLKLSQLGNGKFQVSITDSKGNIASLLPDRTVTYSYNGQTYTTTLVNGVAVFNANVADGDSVRATVDKSDRQRNYDSNAPERNPQYPENTNSPDYPDIQYPGDNGDGQGGDGDGNGSGTGNGGTNNQGNKNYQKQNSQSNGNSTTNQNQNPGNSANQVNDVSQSSNVNSATSESASESGSASGADSQSVVKQIIIEEDDIFRVTGISLIVILIILTIGLYYRDDIKEMNSKR